MAVPDDRVGSAPHLPFGGKSGVPYRGELGPGLLGGVSEPWIYLQVYFDYWSGTSLLSCSDQWSLETSAVRTQGNSPRYRAPSPDPRGGASEP